MYDISAEGNGAIAIYGGCLENLGSHRFLVLGLAHLGEPPCLDLPRTSAETFENILIRSYSHSAFTPRLTGYLRSPQKGE